MALEKYCVWVLQIKADIIYDNLSFNISFEKIGESKKRFFIFQRNFLEFLFENDDKSKAKVSTLDKS